MDEQVPYEIPSDELVATIRRMGEELGFEIARVEEMFVNRAHYDHHNVTVEHSMHALNLTRAYITGSLEADEVAEKSAQLLEETSDFYDSIKVAHLANINRLNQMVAEAVEAGKAHQRGLSATIREVENGAW